MKRRRKGRLLQFFMVKIFISMAVMNFLCHFIVFSTSIRAGLNVSYFEMKIFNNIPFYDFQKNLPLNKENRRTQRALKLHTYLLEILPNVNFVNN